MNILRLGDRSNTVYTLQTLLKNRGYDVGIVDGDFGPRTDTAVRNFQADSGLVADGIVGNATWAALSGAPVPAYTNVSLDGALNIKDYPLQDDEYYKEIHTKDTLYLHHTAGGSNPFYTIDGWERDRSKSGGSLKVATAFVIGRASSRNGDATNDGKIVRAFPERYWAHHLGTSFANNWDLNRRSIAIEVCNFGGLTRTPDGRFLTYVNTEVRPEDVVDLGYTWRGYRYFEKYTDAQLVALKKLVLEIANKYSIDVRRQVNTAWFDMNNDAKAGKPGLWTHVNVRPDKTDCFPQRELIDLINSF